MQKSEKLYKNYNWMHQKYYDECLEVWEIAHQAETSIKMIHEWLQRFEFYSMDEEEFVDIY